MRRLFAAVFLVALMLPTWSPSQAQEPAPGAASATSLGPKRYSIHFAGTVQDALQEIRKVSGWMAWCNDGRKQQAPVALDFDRAPLETIMLSLCEQTGLVYEVQPGGLALSLAAGDVRLDARPAAVVEDWVIRVTDVTVDSRHSVKFRWGLSAPGEPQDYEGTSVALLVCAKSLAAFLRLAGVEAAARATTDTGQTLQAAAGLPPIWMPPDMVQGHNGNGPLGWSTSLNLPMPPDKATKLVRLEGALRLYSQVRTNEFHLKLDGANKPVAEDDMTAVLKGCQETGGALSISVELACPQVAFTPNDNPFRGFQPVVELIGRDGKACGMPMGSSLSYDGKVWRSEHRFVRQTGAPGGALAADVDYVRITTVRFGHADKTLPFVIENIALP